MAALVIKDTLGAKQPQFFKVFLPDVNSKWLHIPVGFVTHLKGKTSGSVFLTGPSGDTWQVHLIKRKDGLCFDEGWSEFAKDHFAEYGDFFVFRHDGEFHFTVTVFDKSACEKQAAFQAKCSQNMSNFVKNKGKKRVKLQADASSHEAFEEGASKRRMNNWSNATRGKNEEPVIQDRTEAADGDQPKSEFGAEAAVGVNLSMWEETYEKRAPHHPFFVRRMTKGNVRHVFILYIPVPVVKEHFPACQSRQIVLCNPEGHRWIVKLVRRANWGSLCAGWSAFVHDNRVKEGDTCRFELVGEFEFLVQIARKNRAFQQVVV